MQMIEIPVSSSTEQYKLTGKIRCKRQDTECSVVSPFGWSGVKKSGVRRSEELNVEHGVQSLPIKPQPFPPISLLQHAFFVITQKARFCLSPKQEGFW